MTKFTNGSLDQQISKVLDVIGMIERNGETIHTSQYSETPNS